jgi:hypothetical protein
VEEGYTTTALLGDARDPERCLRVTWHPDSATVVFSFWNGPVCAASTPVELSDASRLVDLLVHARRETAEGRDPDATLTRLPRRPVRGERGPRAGPEV